MSANNREDIVCMKKPRYVKQKKVGKHKAFLPYIKGVTEKIAKHLKKKRIDYVFLPLKNIKKTLEISQRPDRPYPRKRVST